MLSHERVGTHTVAVYKLSDIARPAAEQMWQNNKDVLYTLLPLLGNGKNVLVCLNNFVNSPAAIGEYGSTIVLFLNPTLWNKVKSRSELEFIIAHEISHYLLGHIKPAIFIKKCLLPANERETLEQVYEREADLHAVKLLGTAQGGIAFFASHALEFIKKRFDTTIHHSDINFDACNPIVCATLLKNYRETGTVEDMHKGTAEALAIAGYMQLGYHSHPYDFERINYLQEWQKKNQQYKSNKTAS